MAVVLDVLQSFPWGMVSDEAPSVRHGPSIPTTFSISPAAKARAVVVVTLPWADKLSMAAVAVSSSGASKIMTPSNLPASNRCP